MKQPAFHASLFRQLRCTAAILSILSFAFSSLVNAEEGIDFDIESLKAQGIDPKLATQFRTAPRFLPGSAIVELRVNGRPRGRHEVTFSQDGLPQVDEAFIKSAGLVKPAGFKAEDTHFDLKSAWAQTEWTLLPTDGRVELVVPPEAIDSDAESSGNWNHGGVAGMVNYDAQYSGSSGSTAGLEFMQLGTEAGFNAGDWIVRSRQTFSRFNGSDAFRHEAAYAQRTFAGLKKVMQAGQINLGNSMFGAGQVLGVQMFPDQALQNNQDGPGLVEGIADTQSVVEVRQSGAVVYTTTVPAGPFRLQGLPLLNRRSDLEVTLTGIDGSKRQYIVPASALLINGVGIAPGPSFGIGKLDQRGASESPLVATLATGWVLTPKNTLNSGIFGSDPWRALGTSLTSQLWGQSLLQLQFTGAQDNRHQKQGLQSSAIFSQPITPVISFNSNLARQTPGYREMSDAITREKKDNAQNTRYQLGMGINWSLDTLGGLGFSWARSTSFSGDNINYLSTSWSKAFGRSYVGLNLEQNNGGRYNKGDKRAYLTVSIPFGDGQSVSSYLNTSESSARTGLRYNNRSSMDRGWSLAADRDIRNQRSSATATMDLVTPISQLSGSISRSSDSYTSYSGRASGSLVAHNGGVTPSSYRVGDTFGIAKVGQEKGIRLDTPAGPTWTDGRGYAVLPSVSSYQRSTIQVDTRSLPKNVDIANAWNETEAARGSVSHIEFDVVRTRRVLATVLNASGAILPYGASVFNEAGDFVTVVGEKGSVFIADAANQQKLEVQQGGKSLCRFSLSLPDNIQQNELFETANATCS